MKGLLGETYVEPTYGPTRRCELLLALDDNTWITEVVDLPAQIVADTDDAQAIAWAQEHLAPLTPYRNVVLFAVYNFSPEEDT